MKIVFDTEKGIVKVGSKVFGSDLAKYKQDQIIKEFRNFVNKNSQLTDYELDSMWMSYRYCIGRHTIASHARAAEIGRNCYERLSDERKEFNAYDINNEIINSLSFGYVNWSFPRTNINRVKTSAIDMCCEFFKEYNIESKDDLLKYKKIIIKQYDNDRGYTFETITWDEYICEKSVPIIKEYYKNDNLSNQNIIDILYDWKNNKVQFPDNVNDELLNMQNSKPNKNTVYNICSEFNDLLIWNNLVNLFDIDKHHKSILVDGSEVEWYWTWNESYKVDKDGNRKEIAYDKFRIPVYHNDQFIWEGHMYRSIPDESIMKDLY